MPPWPGGPRPRPIVWLDEAAARDFALVGPKGATLAALRQAGLPVPAGFCLTAAAFRQLTVHGELAQARQDLARALHARGAWRRESALLRARLAATPLPASLDQTLCWAYRRLARGGAGIVAVRSTALLEDAPGASFAGQFNSLLGVEDEAGLRAAVRSCWLSLWSVRALEYAVARGVDLVGASMAVLVQALVPAVAAGGVLTADPSVPADATLLVTAAWGLGRAVAEAETETDFWRLDRGGLMLERRLGVKRLAAGVAPGGGETWQQLPDQLASSPCLDDRTLADLAALATRAEAALGRPLEIEWALGADQLWLVQARPLAAPDRHNALPAQPLDPCAAPVEVLRASQVAGGFLPNELARPWLEAGERLEGQPTSPGRAVGRARLVRRESDLAAVQPGEVVVASTLRPTWVAVMPSLAGLVVGAGGSTSHAAALAREWRVPAVLGARAAARRIPEGALVLVDGSAGSVWWRPWPTDQAQGGGSPQRLK